MLSTILFVTQIGLTVAGYIIDSNAPIIKPASSKIINTALFTNSLVLIGVCTHDCVKIIKELRRSIAC